MADWKHKKAERDVAALLRAAARVDPRCVDEFPRPIIDLLAASLPALELHRERDLDVARIVAVLLRDHGIHARHLLRAGNQKVAGFTYADKARVVIFVETKRGAAFERFTLAHEAGHIVHDLLPWSGRARSSRAIFGADHDSLSEGIANAIAAELLAPWREVERIAEGGADDPALVDVVRDTFGLSKSAARIRVDELKPRAAPHGRG
ncbi:MAG TPA: ImmA/IrrE family metallo-endopeptidase [Myxococcota bacterium]